MRSSPANCIGLATTLLLLLASDAYGDFRRYSLLDVGPYYSNPIVGSDAPIGLAGSGVALNSHGQVVATELSTATNVSNPYRAFRTAPNQPINFATDDLGTLTPPGTGRSYPTAINDLGQVVGVSGSTAFRTAPQAAIGPLGGLGGLGGGMSSAAAINNLGQVAGAGRTPSGKDHAFRTAPGAAVNPLTDDLGDLFDGNQFSASTGINNKGQVVGLSGINPTRAFRTSPNAKINPLTDDLGSLGGPQTQAIAINDAGQVVGDSDISPNLYHAFRTAPDAAINSSSDLGMPAGHDPAAYRSVAWALNQAGDVVGWYMPVNQAAVGSRAFLFTDDGIVDLNDLLDPRITGWTLMARIRHQRLGANPGGGKFQRGRPAGTAHADTRAGIVDDDHHLRRRSSAAAALPGFSLSLCLIARIKKLRTGGSAAEPPARGGCPERVPDGVD